MRLMYMSLLHLQGLKSHVGWLRTFTLVFQLIWRVPRKDWRHAISSSIRSLNALTKFLQYVIFSQKINGGNEIYQQLFYEPYRSY